MWNRKQNTILQDGIEIGALRAEIARLNYQLSDLRNTRIRLSANVKEGMTLGIRPIWDVNLEYAIMLTNMQGGQGRQFGEYILEIISHYTPLMIPEKGDEEYDSNWPSGRDTSSGNGEGESS